MAEMKTRHIWQRLCDKWQIPFDDIASTDSIDSCKLGIPYNRLLEFVHDEMACQRQQDASVEQLLSFANSFGTNVISIDHDRMVVNTTDYILSYTNDWYISAIAVSPAAKARRALVDWIKVNNFVNEYSNDSPTARYEPMYKEEY